MGMNQHPHAAMVVDTRAVAHFLQKPGLKAAGECHHPFPPGMIRQMIEHVLDRILFRSKLQHLSNPTSIQIMQVPADEIACAVSNRHLLKRAMLRLLSQDLKEPLQRPLVVLRPNRPVAREFGHAGQQRLRLQFLSRHPGLRLAEGAPWHPGGEAVQEPANRLGRGDNWRGEAVLPKASQNKLVGPQQPPPIQAVQPCDHAPSAFPESAGDVAGFIGNGQVLRA